MEESIPETKENFYGKAIRWLKNPYNLGLVLILVFAFVLRLMLNNLDQPLWWDEAEYMLQAKHWAFGTPNSGWNVVRPVLFPFICSIFYKIGFGEIFFRFFVIAFSLLGIASLYLFGKRLFNEKVGIISAFLMSVFYLDLFLSGRFLVEMPSLTLGILGMWLFLDGYQKNKKKMTMLGGGLLGLSLLMRYTGGIFLIVLLVYLIFTERQKFLARKVTWFGALGGLLAMLPYFLWSTVKYGNPIHSLWVATFGAEKAGSAMGFGQFLMYLTGIPGQLGKDAVFGGFGGVLFLVFIASLLFFLFKLVIGFDLFIKRKEKSLDSGFFAFLWIVLPLIYFGFFFQIFEPRYILYSFPAMFLMIGEFLLNVPRWVGKNSRFFGVVIVIVVLVLGGYSQVKMGKELIDSKKYTYLELKEAGEWLKANSEEEDLILNNGVPQNTYYSERETGTVETDYEEKFLEETKKRKPKYLVLSIWEKSQDWLYTYPQKHPEVLKSVQAFYRDDQPEKPLAVIYEFS